MQTGYSVKFNDNDLASIAGVLINYYNATDLPARDIKTHKLARRSLSIITSSEYTEKQITINAVVCAGNRHATEEVITTMKGLLQPQNGELVVKHGNDDYKYTATMNEFNIEWDAGTALCEIIMLASTPISQASTTEILTSFNTTLGSDGATFTVGGSYIAEPDITIVINSKTGSGKLSIYNASTNQGLELSETWANGDIINISCSEYTITRNGVNIDFAGIFPNFPPGAQRIGYSDEFTARNVDVSVAYNRRTV